MPQQRASSRDPIPAWWRAAVDKAREDRGVTNADLAAAYSKTRTGQAYKTAAVRVSRFFTGIRPSTVAFARWIARQLDVPFFVFYADTIEEAEALEAVHRAHREQGQDARTMLTRMLRSIPKSPPPAPAPSGPRPRRARGQRASEE